MQQDSLTWICRMRGRIQSIPSETLPYPVSAHGLQAAAVCSKLKQLPHVFVFLYHLQHI